MADIVFNLDSGLADPMFGKWQHPIKKVIEDRAKIWEKQSLIPTLFDVQTSDKYGETIMDQTGMESWDPVAEGGEVPMTGMQIGDKKFIEHVTFMKGFALTRKAVDDAQYANLRKQPVAFTNGYYKGREELAGAMFRAALEQKDKCQYKKWTFDATSGDGLPLFHNAHKSALKGKGTQCNAFTDEFSVEALDAAETEMQNFTDHNGDLLSIQPTHIVIPNDAQLKRKVFAAIGADQDPDGATNGFNYQYGRWTVVIDPWLNPLVKLGLKPWFLMDESYNHDNSGAVWFDRVKMEITSHIEKNRVNEWTGYARYAPGFFDWRAFCGGGLKTGTKLVG